MTNQELSAFTNIPISFAIVSKQSTFIYVNKEFTKKFSLKSGESHKNKKIASVFGKKGASEMKTYILRAFKGKNISSKNPVMYVDTTKGDPMYFDCAYTPIRSNGVTEGVGIVFQDVTQKKNVDDILQKYKERLDQAQKAAKMGIFDWNLQSNEVWWSEEEESLFGAYPGKFKGTITDWYTSVFKHDKVELLSAIEHAIQNKHDLDCEFRVMYPGNIIHWIRAKGHIYFNKGRATHMVGVHYDVTVRKQNEELLSFKAEASRILSSDLNFKKTLVKVANLAVAHIADWCVVDMIDKDEPSSVVMVAAAHKNKAKAKWARKIRQQYPVDMSLEAGLPAVLKTGNPVFIPYISTEEVLRDAKDEKQRKIIKRIGGVNSIMMLPIKLRGRVVGAITYVASESKRQYTEQDLEMAEQLASRAALAVENATLYENVKAEQKHLDELLENVPAVVWEAWGDPTSPTQQISYVSSYAEKLLGYPREDWLTIPNFWRQIMHQDDITQASLTAQQNFATKDRGISRFRWITNKRKAIWMESQSHIVKNKKGRPIGMRGIVIDISENMALARKKDEFISLASHELKTPITTIKAYTELLGSGNVDSTTKTYLVKMGQQVNKLTRLVSELLDVSKIEEGKLEMHFESFPLDEFMIDSVADLQTIYPSHKIELETLSHARVEADRDRLQQVLVNLVTNAIKYAPRRFDISIRTWSKGNTAFISVSDQGVGISEEQLPYVFTRFYRVKNGLQVGGLGIGLYLSREIVTRHGGEISIKSVVDKGSTFTISLPCQIN